MMKRNHILLRRPIYVPLLPVHSRLWLQVLVDVFCKKCVDKFMAVDKVCLVCNKGCKERNLVQLGKGGTGFAGHGDHLVATDFKHLGSGSGLELHCESITVLYEWVKGHQERFKVLDLSQQLWGVLRR
ncbi:hypothetical protein ACSBR2_015861 [Camellia fascicularis]